MTIKTIEIDNRLSAEPFVVSLGDLVWCAPENEEEFALMVISIMDVQGEYVLYGSTEEKGYKAVSWKDVTRELPKTVKSGHDTQ